MWLYKRTLTIDKDKCGTENSSDFPVLFSGIYSYLATEANGGKVKNANGYDIAFFSDPDLTVLLDFERVSWDPSTGEVQFYVKVPTLSISSDTVIYLGYGNSEITTDQQNKHGTWRSEYEAVWHMEEDPTADPPQISDSTSNEKHATSANMESADSIPGKIGKGLNIDGDEWLAFDGANNQTIGATSISFWLNSPDSDIKPLFEILADNVGCFAYIYQAGKLDFIFRGYQNWYNAGEIGIDTWKLWHLIYKGGEKGDPANFVILMNGQSQSFQQTNAGGAFVANYIGREGSGPSGQKRLDEFRIFEGELTLSWAIAEYNNQNSPSTFYDVGPEVPIGPVGPALNSYLPRKDAPTGYNCFVQQFIKNRFQGTRPFKRPLTEFWD